MLSLFYVYNRWYLPGIEECDLEVVSKTNVWSEGWQVFLELDGGDPHLYEPPSLSLDVLDVLDAVFKIRFRTKILICNPSYPVFKLCFATI